MSQVWAAGALSYLVGAIPTAYLVIRAAKGIDIRTVGSGNVGATNVARVAGGKAGLAVFLIDGAKGFVAVRVIAPWLLRAADPAMALACGVMAVVGHVAPVFLGFRGGKGVATTIGALLAYEPRVAALCGGVWLFWFAVWRYVSVASIAAMMTLPVAQVVLGRSHAEAALGSVLAALVIWKHGANIARLRAGTEPRVGRSATQASSRKAVDGSSRFS